MSSKVKIGLALSGGGIRGISHLGVLKALDELGIRPTKVSGSSAGTIAGAMYCQGYRPEEVLKIILETNFFRFIRPAISWKGILKMESLADLFKVYLPHNDFSKLQIPLTVTTTDIRKGRVVYFDQGELVNPILASSCIPGMFAPIEIGNRFFVDGGVLNNLPIEPLEDVCDVIIGVNCNQLPEEGNIRNIKNLIERSVIMSMNANVYSKKSKCDYFIEPPGIGKYGVFDIGKAPQLFQAGYAQTMRVFESNPSMQDLVTLSSQTHPQKI